MDFIQKHAKGIVLRVFVQPRASKDMIVGPHGDRLKIKVAAPPVEGQANKRCIQFLAKWLSVPRSSLQIISGQNNRNKRILLKSDKSPAPPEEVDLIKQRIDKIINP